MSRNQLWRVQGEDYDRAWMLEFALAALADQMGALAATRARDVLAYPPVVYVDGEVGRLPILRGLVGESGRGEEVYGALLIAPPGRSGRRCTTFQIYVDMRRSRVAQLATIAHKVMQIAAHGVDGRMASTYISDAVFSIGIVAALKLLVASPPAGVPLLSRTDRAHVDFFFRDHAANRDGASQAAIQRAYPTLTDARRMLWYSASA